MTMPDLKIFSLPFGGCRRVPRGTDLAVVNEIASALITDLTGIKGQPDAAPLRVILSYRDREGDAVVVTTPEDLARAVSEASDAGLTSVRINAHIHPTWHHARGECNGRRALAVAPLALAGVAALMGLCPLIYIGLHVALPLLLLCGVFRLFAGGAALCGGTSPCGKTRPTNRSTACNWMRRHWPLFLVHRASPAVDEAAARCRRTCASAAAPSSPRPAPATSADAESAADAGPPRPIHDHNGQEEALGAIPSQQREASKPTPATSHLFEAARARPREPPTTSTSEQGAGANVAGDAGPGPASPVDDDFVKVDRRSQSPPPLEARLGPDDHDSSTGDSDSKITPHHAAIAEKAKLLRSMGFDVPPAAAVKMLTEMGGRMDLVVRALVANNKIPSHE